MFSDLNRFVVKTSRSLDILYDQRDMLSKVTLEVSERVLAFKGMVDKEAVHSLPARSEKMFSLAALYDANDELLTYKRNGEGALFDELVATAVGYWTVVSGFMPDWAKVREKRVWPVELRQENICTHTIVLRAIGALGAELMKQCPSDWKNRLAGLAEVNWSKKNRDWENVCMVANSVVSNRQARLATKAYLKRKLGLPLSDPEERSVARESPDDSATNVDPRGAQERLRELNPQNPENLFFTQIIEGNFGGKTVSNWNELIHCAMRTAHENGVPLTVLSGIANVREQDPIDVSFRRIEGTGLWLQGLDANRCWRCSLVLARKINTGIRVHLRWREKEGAVRPGEEGLLHWSPVRVMRDNALLPDTDDNKIACSPAKAVGGGPKGPGIQDRETAKGLIASGPEGLARGLSKIAAVTGQEVIIVNGDGSALEGDALVNVVAAAVRDYRRGLTAVFRKGLPS